MVGFLIENRPLPLTKNKQGSDEWEAVSLVRKNGRQVLPHGDGIALGLLAQATNLLAVDEPVVAGAFDEGRIVFGLDRKQAIGAHHQVVDVAFAVRQHEVIQNDVVIGQGSKRIGYRHLATLTDKPITPPREIGLEQRDREHGRDQSDQRNLDITHCEDRNDGDGEANDRLIGILPNLLIGELPAISEHQHGEQTTQPQCHAAHGHFAELAVFFGNPLTLVRQDCRRGRTTGVDVTAKNGESRRRDRGKQA